MADFTLQEIAPGVMSALGGVCNRGIIEHNGAVLVVDSGINAAEAAPLSKAARAYHKEGSFYLFNTHPHGDHVYGNQVFADGPIIAHEGVRKDMIVSGERTLANWKQNPQMGALVSDVKITPPTVTFQNDLTVFIGAIEVQLLYCGVAHSPSDSVAWLPQSRVLFAGDLLFNAIVPAMPPGGSSAHWVKALERLEQLEAEHALPGHGPIQTPAALTDLRHWIITLRTQVGEAIASGWDRETTLSKVTASMRASAPRGRDERLPNNIGQVFDEMSRA
jgi:cyclase